MRRLPVYLLLDVSGSMMGEKIESVKTGIQTVQSALRRDPQAMESAFVSVITFSNDVQQVVPLTEIAAFNPPSISAGGGTSLGGALKMVTDCAEREVVKSTPNQKGDWKPMVFIMTDGVPTDNPHPGIQRFKEYKWGPVVACAAGAGEAVQKLLQNITETVVSLDTADSNTISALFKWVSASIATTSKKVNETGSIDSELPPPPPEITLVKP